MAAYAALVSLMANIDQITNHPTLSKCFVKQQMDSLLQKAGSLLDFIEQGRINHEDLEREITSAAHAAEDVVESHVVDQIHAGTLRSVDLQQVIQDMGAVAGKAMEVKKREGVRKVAQQPPITHPTPLMESGGTATMVGLEDELTQLLGSLTDHRSDRNVISIVGMGGTGKTTLAQNLYAHPIVKEHFDIHGWATISQQYDSRGILSQLLSCIGKSTEGNVGELGEQLHKSLFGKRYLIVLDDIWGVEAWDKVRRYLPDGNDRSRVILTTRLSNLASDCGSTCFDLNLLDEDKSWALFCNKAMFPLKDEPPHQLEEVANKIVKQCKGLALSIVVIGGLLLNSPRTLEYWENVLKGLGTTDSNEKQQGLDALFLSYKHLPPHLKPCFLYMGTFEEDSRISASKITRLWVAEGFIKPKGTRVLEEIAEDYLNDLSDRNLVLGLERWFSGKIKSLSIHDLLRDLCIEVGEQEEFFYVRKWYKSRDKDRIVRRVVCDSHGKETGADLARSILGWNYSVVYVKHKLLRVFDATNNKYSEDVYGSNVNLRYLVHNMLSANVCLVWNLQALIIKDSSLVMAPLGIWKMQQLRHVKCRQVYLPDPPLQRYGLDRMEQLQTLRTAVNLRLSEETCEIIPNIKKLHLLYNAKMQGYDDSLMECLRNVNRFHKLESLSMEIMTSKWPYPDPELSSKLTFPLSLTKLCLDSWMLCWEDLSMIGSLPKLQVLHLKLLAVMEGRHTWSPVGGQFLCLKFLEIDCCNLHSWDADSSHFPALEKLVLRSLLSLKEIAEITTLELIHMVCCSESAAISAVKIKKDQLENYDNDTLQIEIKVFESEDLESLKKRLEEEELPLNLINKLDTFSF